MRRTDRTRQGRGAHLTVAQIKRLLEHSQDLLRRDAVWRRRLRIWLVIGGAALAGIANSGSRLFGPDDQDWIVALAIVGAFVALLGGVVLAFVDKDTSTILADALKAEERADAAKAALDAGEARAFFTATLYSIARTGTELIERAPHDDGIPRDVADGIAYELSDLVVAKKYGLLRIGDEEWSLSIFLYDAAANELFPVVSRRRSVEAERAEHRRWPPDAGHVGRAFTSQNVLVCADALDPSEAQYFSAPARLKKESDDELYRSFASIPILLGSGDALGVVVATSDQVGRFQRIDENSEEPDRIEALRLLAGLVALLYSFVDSEEDDDAAAPG